MSKSSVSKKIEKLPPNAKKQAQDFVDYLYKKYVQQAEETSLSDSELDDSFFGIWKDREEMSDSVAWVKKVRNSQWHR